MRRRLGLLLALALVAGCSRGLTGGAGATPTPTEAADVSPPTATPRPPVLSPTPIPPPTAVGRTTRPAAPTPLDGRAQGLTLALDGAPWAAQAGLFVARERGYFAEAGVDLHVDVAESREAALQRLAAGRADLAVVGGLDLLRARGQGTPLVSVFAITPHPLVALITVKDGGAARPRDLAGRSIAMPADRMGRAVVEETLRGDGLDPDKVVVAPPGEDPVGALAARRVDALGGYGPREGAALEARGVAANRLLPTAFGVPDYYELVVATTDAARQGRADALRGFAAAAQRGYAEAARFPDGAVEALSRASPALDRPVTARAAGELAAEWRAGTIGEQAEPRWRASVAFLARLGLTRPDLDPNGAFTNELLPKPSPTPSGSVTPTPSGPTPTPVPRPGAPPPPAAPGRVPTVIRIGP